VTVIDRTGRSADDVAAEIFAAWRATPAAATAALRRPPRTDT
jgi:hypothetical protein